MTDVHQIVCATPQTGKPAPKGAPEPKPSSKKAKKMTTKLPIPTIPAAKQAASAAPADDLGIPDFLDRAKNPLPPLSSLPPAAAKAAKPAKQVLAEAQGGLTGKVADALLKDAKAREEIKAQQAATKKTKAQVRVEKMLAKQAGATKAFPLEGKAAMRAIAEAAGKAVPVTKVPAGKKGAAEPRSPGFARLQASGKAEKLQKETAAMQKAATAMPAKPAPKAPAKPKAKPAKAGESKSSVVKAMLSRPKGATRAEIVAAVDWPSINLKPIAKRMGKKLVYDKESERYRAV